ncbi:MAG TPA: hypothetical protein VHO01_09870 [Jatrophihabitans sp.]|nr:hypothetical protein [Jatrophihabitans sp.]
MSQPRLIDERTPDEPEAAVLVLHGGASRGAEAAVSPTQLSVLRMVPIAKRIALAGHGRLAVFRLLNSARGWNSTRTPVDDVRWALDEVRQRYPAVVRVGLVGHSLGGRAALMAGGADAVHSVVALAPWLYPSDVNPGLAGKRVLIVHGDRDRIASPQRSSAVARQLAAYADVGFVTVRGGKHAMLKRGSVFARLASDFTVACLLAGAGTGRAASPTGGWREV